MRAERQRLRHVCLSANPSCTGASVQEGKAYCLRVRMDMAADNKCLRDPVAYRCNAHPHWRTGTTFKCYPTYDYACPFVDSVQGVTHALRTSEYKDREEQFYRILAMMRAADPSLPPVHIWDYSRLNFVHTGAAPGLFEPLLFRVLASLPFAALARRSHQRSLIVAPAAEPSEACVQCCRSGSCRSWWTQALCRPGQTHASPPCRASCGLACSCRR